MFVPFHYFSFVFQKYLDMSDDTAPTDPPVSNDSAVPPVSINDVNNDTGVTQVQNNIHSPR
jgi:hypothetical protein